MNPRIAPWLGWLLLLPLAALAADGDAPLQVEADRWEADQQQEISVFKGNVLLRKGSIRIEADEARIQARDGKVVLGTIIGTPASFEQQPADAPRISGHARRIEYDAEQQLVILTGAAQVNQGEDEFSGESIRYDLRSAKVLATGDERTPQRVRIIFTPRDDAASKDQGN